MQDALLAVKRDAKARHIPLRYFQWDDHQSLDANFWPSSNSAPYVNPKGSYGQTNAGDVVFQDGVLFLGLDPYDPTHTQRFPLSLYIGHGDTATCAQSSQSGTACPLVHDRSRSGYEWYGGQDGGGVCVSRSFFDMLMKKGLAAGMKMFEQDFICQTQQWTALNLTCAMLGCTSHLYNPHETP